MRRSIRRAGALTGEEVVQLLAPIMPEKNRKEFAERHDTDFAYEIAEPGALPLERVRRSARARRGVPRHPVEDPDRRAARPVAAHPATLCALNKGLVLVTGPTGSGKSTTLCAMIDYINRTRPDHIITIEDPIEFVHDEPEVPDQPARGAHAHRLVQGRAARGAARGSRHRPRRRAARPRDRRHRHRDGRDRPPGVRHAAHDDGGVDRRSRHRPVPGRPAGADPHHAVGVAEGRHRADAVPEDRRRPRRGARSADRRRRRSAT